jgi:hypothetical protein
VASGSECIDDVIHGHLALTLTPPLTGIGLDVTFVCLWQRNLECIIRVHQKKNPVGEKATDVQTAVL